MTKKFCELKNLIDLLIRDNFDDFFPASNKTILIFFLSKKPSFNLFLPIKIFICLL